MLDRNPVVERLATYPAEALYAKRAELQARGLEVFDFSVGDPIEPTDARIRAVFGAAMPAVSQYPTVRGLPELRQACAAWMSRRFGVTVDPAREVLPTSGSKEAIFHLPLAFLDARRRPLVLYGIPAYPVYGRGTLFAGGEPWEVELLARHGYRLQPWELDAATIARTGIMWINYPHNPTAATVDVPYLERVAQFAHEHDILLCCDECYVDLYLEQPAPSSMLQVTRRGVLTFHSLSKRSGMTGYRAGFVAGDAELIATLAHVRANFGTACNEPAQRAAAWAWGDDEHVAERRDLFRAKRDLLAAFFARAGIEHEPCRATLYLWVRAPAGQSALHYAEQLADHGILVSPAPHLGVDQPYVRLALVPSLTDCRRAITVWERVLAS